jgi:hypothetical protein
VANRTLEDFRRSHDPMYGNKPPSTRYARELPEGFKVAIATAAQNSTPVHADFWACLLTAAKHRKAELFVGPTRYKNPTSQWTGSQQNAEHYDAAVAPYLWNQRLALNANLLLLFDVPTQPTAASPLSSLDSMSHEQSGILPHAKLQYKTVPTSGRMPKILTTTGICTVPNYTESRTGKIGEFHHSLSAVIIELDGNTFHLRQLHYSARLNAVTDGVRGVMYLPNGKVKKAPRPKLLGQGDTHVDFVDPQVDDATFRPDGLVQTLRPEIVLWADLLDADSIKHHDDKDQVLRMAKEKANRRNIEQEVVRAIEHVRVRTFPGIQNVIQASNHNDMLRRWVLDGIQNGFRDPLNAPFGLKVAAFLANNCHYGELGAGYPDPFKWLFEQAGVPQSRVLDLDEVFMVGTIRNDMHGDYGPNGSRGSRKNLARTGTKSNIFHSHSPGIEEGCTQAGTSTRRRANYTHGPSSWMQTHILQQHDDKRQLVNLIDGQYTV